MSPLTKVFVVLLVVLSMVTTSAFVVFVNRVEVTTQAQQATIDKLNDEAKRARSAEIAANAAREIANTNRNNAETQNTALTKALGDREAKIADLQGQIARLETTAATQTADAARLTEALNTAQATLSKMNEQNAAQRELADRMTGLYADANRAVTDLTKQLEVSERARKFAVEQLTVLQEQLAARGGAGQGGTGVGPSGVSAQGTPRINGIVTSVKDITGIKYATINVGSADSVAKGMQFQVVDRNQGRYLGTLTVDTVEANEAIGRLDGPAVADIRPNHEVRTQL